LTVYPDKLRLGKLPNGYEYAFPTITEWEYACRAGKVQEEPNRDQLQKVAVFEADDTKHLSVGSKIASDWGLYDMLGNVEEWCREPGAYRGGSWFSSSKNVGPDKGGIDLALGGRAPYRGFRVAGIKKQNKAK
jgi:formylglycine-generating enzyme required for sulfatase activity